MKNNTQNETLSDFIEKIEASIDNELKHDFLTVRQVCEELNIHPNTAYRSIKTGSLRTHNIAVNPSGKNSYRISREDLEDYLANRVAQSM